MLIWNGILGNRRSQSITASESRFCVIKTSLFDFCHYFSSTLRSGETFPPSHSLLTKESFIGFMGSMCGIAEPQQCVCVCVYTFYCLFFMLQLQYRNMVLTNMVLIVPLTQSEINNSYEKVS